VGVPERDMAGYHLLHSENHYDVLKNDAQAGGCGDRWPIISATKTFGLQSSP
jgi:hypothetical protein